MNISLPRFSTLSFTVLGLLLLSILVAAYVPMQVTNAQALSDLTQLNSLKDKATKELDRRLKNFEETKKGLEFDVHLSKDNSSAKISSDGSSASITKDKNGVKPTLELSKELKDKVKNFMSKIIEQLKGLKDKVKDTNSLDSMKSLGKNIDSQFELTQLADVQGTVTKAIESLTGVVDKIKTTFNSLKDQVQAIKDCVKGLKTGESTVDIKATDGKTDVKGTGPGCEDFKIGNESSVTSAESQLTNISTITSTISTVLSSSIALLMALVSQFTSLTGGLGSLGSMGNLGNLGSMGDLTGQLGSLGNIGGLMTSFTAITSQLGIANGMSGNASDLLGNLSGFINLPI